MRKQKSLIYFDISNSIDAAQELQDNLKKQPTSQGSQWKIEFFICFSSEFEKCDKGIQSYKYNIYPVMSAMMLTDVEFQSVGDKI